MRVRVRVPSWVVSGCCRGVVGVLDSVTYWSLAADVDADAAVAAEAGTTLARFEAAGFLGDCRAMRLRVDLLSVSRHEA